MNEQVGKKRKTIENKWKDRMKSRGKLKYRVHLTTQKSLHTFAKNQSPNSQ